MRAKILIAVLALGAPAVVAPVFTGCSAPSQRVVQVQTLKGAGQSAEAAVALSAQLFRDGKISGAQARAVLDFYNQKFQPAFRVAVSAVNANLDSLASPDILSLASQLSSLVASYTR